MQKKKRTYPGIKSNLHPRNKHRERYDFKQLIESCPELSHYVKLNKYDDESIDFFDPKAVKTLNKALLKHYYKISNWDIPENYLVAPIPGRADYIHYMADLMSEGNNGKIPIGKKIRCMDIGVGANCVYPIIGNHEYEWSFVGSEVDPVAIDSANKIIEQNPSLNGKVDIRLQNNPNDIFNGIIKTNEVFDFVICNPPFHSSPEEAKSSSTRKLQNLKKSKNQKPILNFGGQNKELWRKGGEKKFLHDIVSQSKEFATSCFWFSSLVSKQSNLSAVYSLLEYEKAIEVKTIAMGQGNKKSRIVAWTFLKPEQQRKWMDSRWM